MNKLEINNNIDNIFDHTWATEFPWLNEYVDMSTGTTDNIPETTEIFGFPTDNIPDKLL